MYRRNGLGRGLPKKDHHATEANSGVVPGYVHKDMEHWAEEYECAMKHLDSLGVPRENSTGKWVFSIVGRINKAIELGRT